MECNDLLELLCDSAWCDECPFLPDCEAVFAEIELDDGGFLE